MNIDEVESGKGLRFLPSENKKEITNEYLIGLVRYAKNAQITPYLNRYILFTDENRTIYLGLSRWHYQQRRVRARREKLQGKIDTLKKVYEGCNPIITKINRGPAKRGTFVITAIKDSQIHVVYV